MVPQDSFTFSVERWTRDEIEIEQTLCRASHLLVARGAYDAACNLDHRARLTLRQGIRLLEERKANYAVPS